MIKVYWLYSNETDNILTDGYIGISKNTKIRFYQHKSRFGEFKFKVIFYGSLAQCLALEFKLRPIPGIGWNKAPGGFEGYRLGHCEETVRIIKEKRKVQKPPTQGYKHKEETKEKIRASNKGQKRTLAQCANMTGPRHSIESRAKMSETRKGRKHSPESIVKVVAALTGRPVSEDTKAKIGKSNKEAFNRKWSNFNFDMSNVIMLK